MSRFISLVIIAFFIAGIAAAKPLSQKEINQAKKEIARMQKEITRLKKKLAITKTKSIRAAAIDKINIFQGKISKLKKQLAEKPVPPPPVVPEPAPTIESVPEDISASPEVEMRVGRGLRVEAGGTYGFFAGTTAFLGEARFPLKYIFGPATTTLRLSTGLAQSGDTDIRFVPVNLDLVFNFPPGWFTGVENYVGAGLNYILLMTGKRQGTVGGEVFYGIQSEGFGGAVFGEIGYAILRPGFAASHRGLTVMVGHRRQIF